MRHLGAMVFAFGILFPSFPASASAQEESPTSGVVRGVVIDARDGTPLRSVSVRIQDTNQTTLTGEDGRFELAGITPGAHELYVSVVDFILVKRTIDVPSSGALELTIPIAEGTGTYTESVTVRGATPVRQDPEVAAEQTLASSELQQLRTLITNDPFRAIQMLPGVATGDDLRSEFSVRGLAVDHMNFTFEGVSSPLLVHTVQGIQDTGSVAMVNGDVLDEISLLSGSYPQRFGGRTGAELDFRMREGSRDGLKGHVGVSMTDAALVTEGPLGRSRRGSWLFSVRKSYLEMVIRRLDRTNDFGFGFTDAQSKLVYDLNPKHQLQFAITGGQSRLDRDVGALDLDEIHDGRNRTAIAVATWRYAPAPRFVLTQKIAASTNNFSNRNIAGFEGDKGRQRDLLYRADWQYTVSSALSLEGGGETRRSSALRFGRYPPLPDGRVIVWENFDGTATTESTYLLARLNRGRSSIVPGTRVDHFTLTDQTMVSPWIGASLPVAGSITFRGGAGIYRQEPTFRQVVGMRGDSNLGIERAYHADAGLEGSVGRSARWQATVFDREDRDLVRLPASEFRVLNGLFTFPSLNSPYLNALDGHSRGIELLFQRRTPNGLSGWVSYALAYTRYRDRYTGESFWGDWDQRHTVNSYATYRFNDRQSMSVRFRYGSNFPAVGYWERRGDQYFVASTRNSLRVPQYSRLDVRGNRTFTWREKRLTLFVEALNLYARNNVRLAVPGISSRTFQAFGLFDTMLPFVPSVGFLLEF